MESNSQSVPEQNAAEAVRLRRDEFTELDIADIQTAVRDSNNSELWDSASGAWEDYRVGRTIALYNMLVDEVVEFAGQDVQLFIDTEDAAAAVASKIVWAVGREQPPKGGWRIGQELEALLQMPIVVNGEQAVRMVALFGLYDLHKRGDTDQLAIAVNTLCRGMESASVSDFDPIAAGYDDVRGDIMAAIAAMRIDNAEEYGLDDMVPRNILLDRLYNQLGQLNEAAAHMGFSEGGV